MKTKRLLVLIGMALVFCSCGEPRYMLYNWGKNSSSKNASEYEALLYDNYHTQSPESVCALICQYEYMVTHPGGLRKVVPPGICAEYGYLLLSPETPNTFLNHATRSQKETFGTAGDYGALFREKGLQMFQKEMELYPESTVFIEPLVKKLSQQ